MNGYSLSSRTHRIGRHERHRRHRDKPRRSEKDSLKCKIPSFLRDSNSDAYLDWDMKVEQILECFDFNEETRVKVVTFSFCGYTLTWWSKGLDDFRRSRRPTISTWVELIRVFMERFVPSFYSRDLYNKLQRLYQGSRSVEEYHKEVEITLMRAQVEESQEATMARFFHGINREIQDIKVGEIERKEAFKVEL